MYELVDVDYATQAYGFEPSPTPRARLYEHHLMNLTFSPFVFLCTWSATSSALSSQAFFCDILRPKPRHPRRLPSLILGKPDPPKQPRPRKTTGNRKSHGPAHGGLDSQLGEAGITPPPLNDHYNVPSNPGHLYSTDSADFFPADFSINRFLLHNVCAMIRTSAGKKLAQACDCLPRYGHCGTSLLCLCYSLINVHNAYVVMDGGLNYNNVSADHTGESL